MYEYVVRYSLGAYVYESYIRCSSSDAAIMWVQNAIPNATNIFVMSSSQ